MQSIIIISPAHPLRGGIAASTERLAEEWQKKGAQVTIFSFQLQYPSFLFPGKTQFTDDPPPQSLHIKTAINSINPFNWIKVGLQIRKLNPDLIVTRYWLPFMGPCLGTILRIAGFKNQTNIQVLADNIIPHEKRPGDVLFTKYLIGAVDGFVVMSRKVGNDIRGFTTSKPIQFTHHPLYDNYGATVSKMEARNHLQLDPSGKYLLFFGFIRDYKGLDLLLQAMSDDRIRSQNIQLIVAGEYYGKEDFYANLIESLGIKDQLIMHTHFIPSEKVKDYFGAADLVVQPYRTATQSGISQIAFHFDKPMVVTKVGGLPEIVTHQKEGYVIEKDPSEITEAVLDFYKNQREAKMVKAVQHKKHIFSWSKLIECFQKNLQSST